MGAEAAAVGPRKGWSTWEELILGGAVLRHGSRDWNVVASELRTRSLYPCAFTPEACKAKYEDLQKRYSGSMAWFEELRKQRVEELKRELARSEDSIGSLESRIKFLEADKPHSNQADVSSRTESPLPLLNSDGTESCGKETPKDETSAGSFTKDTWPKTNWFRENNYRTAAETDVNLETSVSSDQDTGLDIEKLLEEGRGMTIRKRRGQRKRKDCSVKEDESENLGSSNFLPAIEKETSKNDCKEPDDTHIRDGGGSCTVSIEKETSKNDCKEPHDTPIRDGGGSCTVSIEKETSKNDCKEPDDTRTRDGGGSCTVRRDELMEIFKLVAKSEAAGVFRHRMDSQKRARYRKVIRQHLDIGMIKSRIMGQAIKSAKELFRDLLLLANNALVFYSRRTREYKSAISLRQLVMKEYKQQCRGYCHEATSAFIPCNPPVKPRSARPRPLPRPPPCKDESLEKSENVIPEKLEKPGDLEYNVSLHSLVRAKKGVKRAGKDIIKPELVEKRVKTSPVKQRKKVRK